MVETSCRRWLAAGIFTLYTALNFLDRQALAALAPAIRGEFHLSNADYGWLLAGFSIAYSAASPAAGLLVDRLGLTGGAVLTLAVWSLAGMATGGVESFAALLACRVVLGIAEAGGVPAYAKANATYLPPRERSLGAALNQGGISLGSMGAPLLAGWLAARCGWRSAFVAAGALGLVWIPLWLGVSRRLPPLSRSAASVPPALSGMLSDRRFWALCGANMLAMTTYSLWINWTTVFLVEAHHLPAAQANRQLAWIPPLFATLGGFAGGWLALRWSRGGAEVQKARLRVVFFAGVGLLATAAVPWLPRPGLATAAISLSFFLTVAMSVNIYAMPLDLFGAGRAAFAVSSLTLAYGAMQAVFSPAVGIIVDRYGFPAVCVLVAGLPLGAWFVLRRAEVDGAA